MRVNHSVDIIEQVEKELIATGMVILGHDASRSFFMFPTDRKTTRSRFFTKIYEVYIDPKAKEIIKSKKIDTVLDLFLMHQIFVKLCFDYRDNTGSIDVPNSEVKRLIRRHPFMDQYLNSGVKSVRNNRIQRQQEYSRSANVMPQETRVQGL